MKSKTKKPGFSIIELLTVMSIIIILIAILMPSLSAIRKYAKMVRQKGMFHDIGKGLEMFSVDFNGYPDSSAGDPRDNYCGAMKLCEAMVGQDALGFHPKSVFDDMGQAGGVDLYYNRTPLVGPPYSAADEQNLRTRKTKYMGGEDVQVAPIETLFKAVGTGQFDPCCPVLCDVFKRTQLRGVGDEKAGMPVLYYKADPSKLMHDVNDLTGPYNSLNNIYNYYDNYDLIELGVPWTVPVQPHPYKNPPPEGGLFYKSTRDKSVTPMMKPHNPDSYILISAGWDGLYGTGDDVFNFED